MKICFNIPLDLKHSNVSFVVSLHILQPLSCTLINITSGHIYLPHCPVMIILYQCDTFCDIIHRNFGPMTPMASEKRYLSKLEVENKIKKFVMLDKKQLAKSELGEQ